MVNKKTTSKTQKWNLPEVSEKQYKNSMKAKTEYDTRKYEKTYNIIYKVSCLTVNMFQVKQKKELMKELQTTIQKLNELLVELKNEKSGK